MAVKNKNLNAFVFLYVVLPVFVILAIFNAHMFNQIFKTKGNSVLALRASAVNTVENAIAAGEKTAITVGYLPEVLAILEANTDAETALRTKEWTFETWFEQMVAEAEGRVSDTIDPQLIINNDITRAMKQVQRTHPELGRFLITDALGTVIASSHLPDSTTARSKDWWQEAFKAKTKPYYEGMTEDGLITINYSIWSATDVPVPIGMARIDLKVDVLVDTIPEDVLGVDAAFIVMGSRENREGFRAGNPEIIKKYGDKIVSYLGSTGRESGWVDGVHYSRAKQERFPLEKDIRVLAIQEGGLINFKAYVPVGISTLVSVAGLALLTILAYGAGNRMQRASLENIQAGNWVLHRMRGDSIKEASGSKVAQDLDGWMNDFRRSIVDNVEVQEYENKRELHLAREFQLSYMSRPYPRIPEVHVPGRLKINFYHHYKPAMGLGGDFFEILKLGPETAGMVISDVMGHGTRSALITSNLRSIMSELQSQGRNARNFLREMNRSFYNLLDHIDLTHPIFASAFYFVADTGARSATFSTAGHPAPFHMKRAMNHVERLQVASPHGAALGIVKDEDYTGGSCRLAEGDVFVFFTDGVYEAFNGQGEEFGLDRLDRTIRKLMHNSMEGIVDGIVKEVDDFTAGEPLRDDICIVAIEVSGS
jgi:serine phosphatase RsbU (regulator of sigma subunit)